MRPSCADMMLVASHASHVPARAQRGLSLMIVLIALVVMSLAAVGLMRMVDTSSLVAGNIAFKQGTTSAADAGVEAALTWLQTNSDALAQKNEAAGYYPTSLEELDVVGRSSLPTRVLVDWHDNDCAYAQDNSYAKCIQPSDANSSNGYTTRYVITRMCKTEGASTDGCAKPLPDPRKQSPARGAGDYTNYSRGGTEAGPFFRIVVRSEGPRNTVSFTESYVHF